MNSYTFSYTQKKASWGLSILIFAIILIILTITKLNLEFINIYQLRLILTASSAIYIFKLVRDSKFNLKELILDDNKFILSFHFINSNTIVIQREGVFIEVDANEIRIFERVTKKLIAKGKKNNLINLNDWENLINSLTSK